MITVIIKVHYVLYISECDQIGRFFKVIDDKYSFKGRPNIFWATSGGYLATFGIASGHTDISETVIQRLTTQKTWKEYGNP